MPVNGKQNICYAIASQHCHRGKRECPVAAEREHSGAGEPSAPGEENGSMCNHRCRVARHGRCCGVRTAVAGRPLGRGLAISCPAEPREATEKLARLPPNRPRIDVAADRKLSAEARPAEGEMLKLRKISLHPGRDVFSYPHFISFRFRPPASSENL